MTNLTNDCPTCQIGERLIEALQDAEKAYSWAILFCDKPDVEVWHYRRNKARDWLRSIGRLS